MKPPENIDMNHVLQIAIDGRDTLVQMAPGGFRFTDYGIECSSDDIRLYVPWDSVQWLEQSEDIDRNFNNDTDAFIPAFDNSHDVEQAAISPDNETMNPFDDLERNLFKRAVEANVIIHDDNGYKVKFSGQRLGESEYTAVPIIQSTPALKAYLAQEIERAHMKPVENIPKPEPESSAFDDGQLLAIPSDDADNMNMTDDPWKDIIPPESSTPPVRKQTDSSIGMNTMPTQKTVETPRKERKEHLTEYAIDDMTDGNASTKDENGYDWVVLMGCTGFTGSIVSRWATRAEAESDRDKRIQDNNAGSSLVKLTYMVFHAKGNQLVNRKYIPRDSNGMPIPGYNSWGEKETTGMSA